MANWQERIRQALGPEQQKLSAQQEKDRKLEIVRQGEEKATIVKIELLSTLERIGAKDLLRQIKEEVWKVGTVDSASWFGKELRINYEIPPAFAALSLRFQYKTAVEILTYKEPIGGGYGGVGAPGDSHSSGYSGTGTYSVGKKDTILTVSVHRRSEFDNRLRIEAGDYSTDVITKDSLEQLLLKDCVRRTSSQHLPLQLQTKGQEDIKRLVNPLRRLF